MDPQTQARDACNSNHRIVMTVITSIVSLAALFIGGALIIVAIAMFRHLEIPSGLNSILSGIVGGGISLAGSLSSFLVKTSPTPQQPSAVTVDQPADHPIPTSDSGPTVDEK